MVLYDIYYRTHGVRRASQMQNPVINDISAVELPRDSIYHYNPESPLLYGPLENNAWYKNSGGLRFIEHVVKFTEEPIGTIMKKPINETQLIQAYRRKHRTLRLLRDFLGVNRQPQMLMVYNYCLLNQLWRYRPHRFVHYYQFYNLYSTIISTINSLAKQTHRHQFFEVRLPKVLQTRMVFNNMTKEYPKGISNRILSYFPDSDSLLLLHLWMWLSNNRSYSIFNKLDPAHLSKINLLLTDSGKYILINMGELEKWRETNQLDEESGEFAEVDTDGNEPLDEEAKQAGMLLQRFHRMLTTFFGMRTVSPDTKVIDAPTYTEQDLNDTTPVDENDETTETVPEQTPETGEPETKEKTLNKDKFKEQLEEFITGEKKEKPDGKANLKKPDTTDKEENKDTSTHAGEPIASDNQTEDKPQVIVDTQPEEYDENYEPPKDKRLPNSPLEDTLIEEAYNLLDAGDISAREFQRIQKMSQKYKEIPSPFDDGKSTIEEYMKVDEETINNFKPIEVPDSKWILDKSMLKSPTESFDREYIKKVHHKNVTQSIMSLQKAGIMVSNIERVQHIDKVNAYEDIKVTVQPIGGTQTTLNIRLPIIAEDGTMLVSATKYRLLKQRSDQKNT